MMINSKRKGKTGERELASVLRSHGYDCRRGQQYCGADGSADVIGIDGLHIECKRTERLNLYDALDQARRDAKDGNTPVVMHRKSHCDWVVILRLDDFMEIYREWEAGIEK
jgi:Holliday junction resolvase